MSIVDAQEHLIRVMALHALAYCERPDQGVRVWVRVVEKSSDLIA